MKHGTSTAALFVMLLVVVLSLVLIFSDKSPESEKPSEDKDPSLADKFEEAPDAAEPENKPAPEQEEPTEQPDGEEYVTVSASVDHISHNTSRGYVCIGIPEPPEHFSDTSFEVSGDSYQTILENGFEEKVVIGKEITFISAPRYFGDGYMFINADGYVVTGQSIFGNNMFAYVLRFSLCD